MNFVRAKNKGDALKKARAMFRGNLVVVDVEPEEREFRIILRHRVRHPRRKM